MRALPSRVPLGPRPWLHRLRHRLRGLVRRLHSYYDGVRLLTIVHHRLRLLTFPMRTRTALGKAPLANREISQFPHKERPHMPRSSTTPGRAGTRADAPVRIAFRKLKDVGTRDQEFSRLNSLAYAIPCQRFADTLASACA